MRKFLLKCTALVLAIAAALYAGGVLYKQTNAWKNLEKTEETDGYHTMPDIVSFAVVGPSHGRYAFRAEDWGEGFFNFAMAAQTPQYDLRQLREFSDRIEPGATVVLTVSYMSPFWTDTPQEFESKQERYYRILSRENIVDFDAAHWWLGRFSPLLTTDTKDLIAAWLYQPELLADDDTGCEQTLEEADLELERERIAKIHLGRIEPAMPDGNPAMLAAYGEILALCREKGWNPILVTPPYLRAYTDCIPEEILTVFRTLVQTISEENGVMWLDYSQDADFAEDYAYYKDLDHMNSSGAAAFAEKIQPQLHTLGLWN